MLSFTGKYEIINIIPSLDSNKSTGPNSIPKGRKTRYETNPYLFNCVTSFLKQNSFATDEEERQVQQQELELHYRKSDSHLRNDTRIRGT